jgi:hypothetical protein
MNAVCSVLQRILAVAATVLLLGCVLPAGGAATADDPPRSARVPRLVGRTTDGARAALRSVGLDVGAVAGKGTVVRRQTEPAGGVVPSGTLVGIFVVPRVTSGAVVPVAVGGASGRGGVVRSETPQADVRIPAPVLLVLGPGVGSGLLLRVRMTRRRTQLVRLHVAAVAPAPDLAVGLPEILEGTKWGRTP